MSNVLDAWAAGFYEGEGSATIGCLKPPPSHPYDKPHVKARIAQVDRWPLDRLKRNYGGCVTRRRVASSERQDQWVWEVAHRKADKFFQAIWDDLSDRRQKQIRAAYTRAGRDWT